MTDEPQWLPWLRELQAIAQTGLAFTRDPYDRERYEALQALAARITAAHTDASAAWLESLFADQAGYATPKVDVRGACFDAEGRLLMVREVLDDGRWTLPGGWADVTVTPAENVIKEVQEESGYLARVVKCAGVWDRTRQGHTPAFFSCVKLFYICELVGGSAQESLETTDAAFFAEADLPADISTGRVLAHQLRRMFAHWHDRTLPTEFE